MPQPQNPDPEPNTSEANKITDKIIIPLVNYIADENLPESNADNDKSTTPPSLVYTTVKDYTVIPREENFRGGSVIYNYVDDHIYKIFIAPGFLTEIQLKEGETIVAPPAAGDTLNFMLETSLSGEDTNHIYLKALAPYKETTLVINTNKRIYRFHLESYKNTFMPLVYFKYPIEEFEQIQEKINRQTQGRIVLHGDVRDFNFSYEIIPHKAHMPAWGPSFVFSDGIKTYIHFPSARRTAKAPALFVVDSRKERTLVNYRVTGNYYVVDEVLDHAELVVDINAGNVITIKRGNK